jgi:hypothetical protein
MRARAIRRPVRGLRGNNNSFCNAAGVCETLPTITTPPALDGATGTDFGKITDGIWKGSQPIQTGVAATKIELGHAGWLIGKVKTASGAAMTNVKVTIVLSLTLFRRAGFALLRDDCGLESHAARQGQRQSNVGVA